MAAAAESSDCATTPLVTPPEEEKRNAGGGGTGLVAGEGGGSVNMVQGAGEGGKGFVAESEAFVRWSHRTGELQKVPPLESVDLPGEKDFTEGCLKVINDAHVCVYVCMYPGVVL